jgi:hypothetical protein
MWWDTSVHLNRHVCALSKDCVCAVYAVCPVMCVCRSDAPLPGPPASAQALRARALEVIEEWQQTLGEHYPQVQHMGWWGWGGGKRGGGEGGARGVGWGGGGQEGGGAARCAEWRHALPMRKNYPLVRQRGRGRGGGLGPPNQTG